MKLVVLLCILGWATADDYSGYYGGGSAGYGLSSSGSYSAGYSNQGLGYGGGSYGGYGGAASYGGLNGGYGLNSGASYGAGYGGADLSSLSYLPLLLAGRGGAGKKKTTILVLKGKGSKKVKIDKDIKRKVKANPDVEANPDVDIGGPDIEGPKVDIEGPEIKIGLRFNVHNQLNKQAQGGSNVVVPEISSKPINIYLNEHGQQAQQSREEQQYTTTHTEPQAYQASPVVHTQTYGNRNNRY